MPNYRAEIERSVLGGWIFPGWNVWITETYGIFHVDQASAYTERGAIRKARRLLAKWESGERANYTVTADDFEAFDKETRHA